MLATAALVLALAGPDPAAVQHAAASVLARQDYQRQLPNDGPARRERVGHAARPEVVADAPRPVSIGVPPMLVWILVAGAGLALVLWARREFGHAARVPAVAPAEAETTQGGRTRSLRRGPRARVLDDAEGLALEGRFAEAVHALLLLALAKLLPAPALTAREVLRQAEVQAEARSALAALVSEAERVHFAGGAAGAAEYERCRNHWRRFGAACRASRA